MKRFSLFSLSGGFDYRKPNHCLLASLLLSGLIFLPLAFSQTTNETFTISTYYPSPYGVYSEMRLYPKADATCNTNQIGLMYYDNTLGEEGLKVCGGSPLGWQGLGGQYDNLNWVSMTATDNSNNLAGLHIVGAVPNGWTTAGIQSWVQSTANTWGLRMVWNHYKMNPAVAPPTINTLLGSGTATGVGYPGGVRSTNYIPKFYNPHYEANSQIYDNGTNVGIGTTITAGKLHVVGSVIAEGDLLKSGNIAAVNNAIAVWSHEPGSGGVVAGMRDGSAVVMGGPGGQTGFGANGPGASPYFSLYRSAADNLVHLQTYPGGRNLVLGEGYNVGIGIGPWAKLDVYGSTVNIPGFRTLNSAYNRYIFMVPELGPFGYNSLSQSGDSGIFFSNLGGLVIGPWGSNYGIRIAGSGDVGIGTTPLSGAALTQRLGTGNRLSFSGWYNSGGPGQPYLEFNIDNVALFGISVWPSSKKNKTDIADIEVNTENIYNLRPVSFYYKDQEDKALKNFGLIAEEAEEFFPQLVLRSSKNNEIIGFDYGRLSVLVLSEVKKLKKEIESLKAQIEKLEERGADLKTPR